MALSKKQTSLYWRTWGAVCAEQGWTGKERDERRKAVTKQAGLIDRATGEARSMMSFGNRDLDLFLAECAKLLGTHTAAATTDSRERKRLIWRIEQDAAAAGLQEPYIEQLSTDLYGLACWRQLAIDDLTKLRDTIHNRAAKKSPRPRVSAACPPVARSPRRTKTPRPAMRETSTALATATGHSVEDDDNIPF